MTDSPLLLRFRANIDEIATALVASFGLRFNREVSTLSSPVSRWMDFRMRYVEPHPREVIESDRFPKKIPADATRALSNFRQKIQLGHDLNPYQGRGLKSRNDTSREVFESRTDFLFAHWGILHFHLTDKPIPAGNYFSAPADWLAFCMVTPTEVALIDVIRHPDRKGFADPALLETALRSWPHAFESCRIPSSAPTDEPAQNLTHDQIATLRDRGTNHAYVYNGVSYWGPGGGVMSAGVSFNATLARHRIERDLEWLSKLVKDPAGGFVGHPELAGIADLELSIRVHRGGLGFYEESSQALLLDDRLAVVTNLLLPDWALRHVIASKHDFDAVLCEFRSP